MIGSIDTQRAIRVNLEETMNVQQAVRSNHKEMLTTVGVNHQEAVNTVEIKHREIVRTVEVKHQEIVSSSM